MAAALMQAYSAMNGWMNEEGIVNGMWTAILNELFPQNTLNFLIGPEVHSANNTNRADLSIYEIDTTAGLGNYTRKVVVVYEGKRSGSTDGWDDILTQCDNWTRRQPTNVFAVGECCWYIGAKGGHAKLWVCKRIGTGSHITDFWTKSLIFNHGQPRNGAQNSSTDGYPFDLTNPNDCAALDAALTYMRGNLRHRDTWGP